MGRLADVHSTQNRPQRLKIAEIISFLEDISIIVAVTGQFRPLFSCSEQCGFSKKILQDGFGKFDTFQRAAPSLGVLVFDHRLQKCTTNLASFCYRRWQPSGVEILQASTVTVSADFAHLLPSKQFLSTYSNNNLLFR